jgi:hypothetical protein
MKFVFCRLWHRDITIGLAVGLLKKGRVGEGRAVKDVSRSSYFVDGDLLQPIPTFLIHLYVCFLYPHTMFS